MNKKLLTGLAALLILTATACQNTAKPSGTITGAQPGPSGGTEHSKTTPAQITKPTDTAPSQPPTVQSAETLPSPKPSAAPPEVPKTAYRLNPKSYDIQPIDPSVTEKKMVLLTFDDGPKDKEMLESMLNTLDKHHAKAIFFVNGYRVKQKPELLKLIHERGQTIGNHSWDHIDLKKENEEKVNQQIGDVQAIVKEAIGEAPRFFRPPFGSGGDIVKAKVKEEQMLFMTWSNGSKDWEMSTKNNNPDQVVANVLEQLRPGSNILMHELPWTDKALDKLLTELEQKQYGFIDPATIEITP
ncbi:polysaccharide deacetylase family protein [Paenibacillus sp. OAS669]|uniref:polysaccharide deacetylase family protein n=1 Tax=Paenibacillus sp. OAS669 TaxID=2663821 RepID=UPI00178BE99E|nr:polysaccharide deacetylase family protein [Paenibacillus sp. OAS669]MBE1445998.1 peptidoglycan/xylan/chitin deacetylase (PgdA/CDA1 family) [Paenibacillus sp. OAS669]